MTTITNTSASVPVSRDRVPPVAALGLGIPSGGTDLELIAIIQKYNEVTEHLKKSHERLSLEVCRLREALHEKNRELQRREQLAALGEMAAGVAHEIRNPLGGIGLYASLLERDLEDRPKQRDLARRIGRGVQSLDTIVGDILTFAGDALPAIVEVSLEDLFAGVVVQTEPKAEASGVSVEIDDTKLSTVLRCDVHQMTRAVSNLVFNAIDAVGEGGHVWISGRGGSVRRPDGGAEWFDIRVEDDGPGIKPDHLQRVFTPFFTTKHTGTGLGLAIVHRIAEANGGVVRAGNREKSGAVFVLSVPVA